MILNRLVCCECRKAYSEQPEEKNIVFSFVTQGIAFHYQRFAVKLNHNIIGTVALAQEVFSLRSITVDVGGSIAVQTAV
jgi:hypothetical protein